MRLFSKISAFCVILSCPAAAHVVLEKKEAPIASYYKAVLQVGHGCQGSPTKTLHVRIPEGVIAVKPMPKAGWTVTTVSKPYAETYRNHGQAIKEGVVEILWSGGTLPDDFYDEFVFLTRLTEGLKPGTLLSFPVVQDCETGSQSWTNEPENDGHHHHGEGGPAPSLKLLPAERP